VIEQMRNVHPAILPEAARRAGARLLLGLCLLCAAGSATATLRMTLGYQPEQETMQVQACSDVAAGERYFRLHRGGAANISGLTRTRGTLEKTGDARWRAVGWKAGDCLSYRALLGPLSRSRDADLGSRIGSDLLVAPQQWLLLGDSNEDTEVSVKLPAGYAFSPPWQELEDSTAQERRYRVPPTPPGWSALVAVGRFEEFTVTLTGGTVRVALLGDIPPAQRATLRAWLETALRAVATAQGQLPLPYAQVVVRPAPARRSPVGFGQSLRGQGNAVHFWVDPSRPLQELNADWTAVHEFAHWAHPYLGDDGAWLAEGLASYWQNVLRARAVLLTPQQAWQQLDAGFGRGRGAADDALTLAELSQAMHARRAYYAVYWSGAVYWLQVDVDLRHASGGKFGVEDALARFRACCLLQRREWDGRAFVAKLDELAGSDAFGRRYAEFAQRRGFPPLEALYQRLGLRQSEQGLRLGDGPDAAIRDVIMRPR
jgi:hypothetical protein